MEIYALACEKHLYAIVRLIMFIQYNGMHDLENIEFFISVNYMIENY